MQHLNVRRNIRRFNKVLIVLAMVIPSIIIAGFIPIPISVRLLSGSGPIPFELKTFLDWNFCNFSLIVENTTVSTNINGENYTFTASSMTITFEIISNSETRNNSTDYLQRGFFDLDMHNGSIVSSKFSAQFGTIFCRLNFETNRNGTEIMYFIDGTTYVPFWFCFNKYLESITDSGVRNFMIKI